MTATIVAPSTGPPTAAADLRRRAAEALLGCVARHGLSKTTLDDVAREAGCARATLYRHVGGKRQLVAETVATEAGRMTTALREAAAAASTLEDAVVAVTTGSARELASHEALQFLLANESEIVLPFATFEGADRLLAGAAEALGPCFERFLPPSRARRLGEWVARVVLAHAGSRAAPVDLADESAARHLVRSFVLPGFLPITGPLTGPVTESVTESVTEPITEPVTR